MGLPCKEIRQKGLLCKEIKQKGLPCKEIAWLDAILLLARETPTGDIIKHDKYDILYITKL